MGRNKAKSEAELDELAKQEERRLEREHKDRIQKLKYQQAEMAEDLKTLDLRYEAATRTAKAVEAEIVLLEKQIKEKNLKKELAS